MLTLIILDQLYPIPGQTVSHTIQYPAVETDNELKEIFYSFYSSVLKLKKNEFIVPDAPTFLPEELFLHPLDFDQEESYFLNYRRNGQIISSAHHSFYSSYGLRCYNSYLIQLSWMVVEKKNNPNLSNMKILYSFKKKYFDYQLKIWISINEPKLTSLEDFELKKKLFLKSLAIEWNGIKQASKIGKPLKIILSQLNLNTTGMFVDYFIISLSSGL
jgi:hypothetical protein